MQVRPSASGAFLALTLVIALLAGCSGGSVSTTPVSPAISGTASSTLSVATAGGYAPLPSITGMSGSILVPPAIGAAAPVPANVTVSSTQPSNVPAPPVSKALAYVSFIPTGAMNVPWLPQFDVTFANGAVPAGAQVVWYYYRLGGTATTQSRRQFARERRGEWQTERELLAQTAPSGATTAWTAAAPAGAGAAGTSAGVAGISVGTIANIAAGVVAVATIAAAVAGSASAGGPQVCQAACTPSYSPSPVNVAAGATASVQVTSTSSTVYTAALQDCANASGAPASAASIASLSSTAAEVTAGAPATFTVSGVATGTCALAVSGTNLISNPIATTVTVTVGAGAPIQGGNASTFATPGPSPTPTPSLTPSPSPSPAITASPSPTATASVSPTASPTPTASSSGPVGGVPSDTTNVFSPGGGLLAVPSITGIDAAKSSISYPASTGATTEEVFVTGSTTNFASLPAVAGHTAFLYFTAATSTGSALTFGSGSGETLTLTGSAFTAGQTYYVGYTQNGMSLGSTLTVVATANGSEGEIDAATPFNNLTMNPDDIIGIVIAQ